MRNKLNFKTFCFNSIARKKILMKHAIPIQSRSGFKGFSQSPKIILSDLKTLYLPRVFREGDDDVYVDFMIFNKFPLAPTATPPPPYWQYRTAGKIANGSVLWTNLSLAAPVEIEERATNPNYQLILRLNLYYKSGAIKDQLMGFCECDLLGVYDDLVSKDSDSLSPKSRPRKAISRYLSSEDPIISKQYQGNKPVISFTVYLESPPVTYIKSKNNSQSARNAHQISAHSAISQLEPVEAKGKENPQPTATEAKAKEELWAYQRPHHITTASEMKIVTVIPSSNRSQPHRDVDNFNPPSESAIPTVKENDVPTKSTSKFEKLRRRSSQESGNVTKPEPIQPKSFAETVKRSLFDEIFSLVLRKYAGTITVTWKELCIILDAIDVPVRKDLLTGNSSPVLSSPSSANSEAASIQLPISNAAALAAVLSTEYWRWNFNSSSGGNYGSASTGRFSKQEKFTISEQQAEIVITELQKLIRGNFERCKECILKLCGSSPKAKDSTSASGRPSNWTSRQVLQFISSLGFEMDRFSGLNGVDLLKLGIDNDSFKELDISLPVLQKRFVVYRQTILYIDKWWEHGLRPTNLFSSSELKQLAKNGFKKQQSNDESLPRKELAVKVADFNDLLAEVTRFNRAYGWSVPPGTLASFCSLCAGREAVIILTDILKSVDDANNSTINSGRSHSDASIDFKNSNESASHPSEQIISLSGSQLPVVKGCKWLRIAMAVSEIKRHPTMGNASTIWRDSIADGRSSSLEMDEYRECYALIPSICCRKVSDNSRQLLDIGDDNAGNSLSNALLIAANVRVGMIATIVDYSTLVRLSTRLISMHNIFILSYQQVLW